MRPKERRRSTSLHARCNRALELRNRIRMVAHSDARIPLTSSAIMALIRNAEDIRYLMGVQEDEPAMPLDRRAPLLNVDHIALPQPWISRLNQLVERELNSDSRRVLRSKIRYAVWNLRFAALMAGFEDTLRLLVLPPEQEITQDSVREAAGRQRRNGISSGAPSTDGRREAALARPATSRAVITTPRPEKAGIARNGPADCTEPDTDNQSDVELRPTMGIAQQISSTTSSAQDAPDIRAAHPATSSDAMSGRGAPDLDDASPPTIELAPGVAPVTGLLAGDGRGAEDRGCGVERALHEPTDIATTMYGATLTAAEANQALPVGPDIDAAAPAGYDVAGPLPVRTDAEGTGRVLFDPPVGEGLIRTVDGITFLYNAVADAWMDETQAQHRARVDRAVERLLSAAPASASELWHAFLPVPASLETSRQLVTTILGGYTELIGRDLEEMHFEIRAAAPLERIGLQRMLQKSMLVTWEDTPWSEKVMAKEPSNAIQVGTALWQTIKSDHRINNATLATWIDVEREGAETTTEEDGSGDDELECSIDLETGDPRSRFAEVAAAIRAKSLPRPQSAPSDENRRVIPRNPLPAEASVLLLGIGGSGKTHLISKHLDWLRGRYSNTRIFSLNAARAGAEKKMFRTIVREIAMAEAEGTFCIFVCDEVQHLSATDLERLGACAAVVLAGDIRQSGSGDRVHPVIAFARRTGARVIDMTQVWRASNTSLLNQISYAFYDGAVSALGRGDGLLEPPIFRYDICADDAEVIAARCWAAARNMKATDRSLMLVIERDDIRDILVRMAGSDKRQWTKGTGSVTLLSPSQIQGREADVLLFLPADYMESGKDPARIARDFLTLMGRSRQEIWILFTRYSSIENQSARVFASLLRSFLETSVIVSVYHNKVDLHSLDTKFLAGLDLTACSVGGWQFLAYRGLPVALYEDHRRALISGSNRNLSAFAELKGWPVLSISTDASGTRDLHSIFGAERAHDDIQKMKAKVDRHLAAERN